MKFVGVIEVFDLVGSYAALVDTSLLTFRHNIFVPSSRVQQFKKNANGIWGKEDFS